MAGRGIIDEVPAIDDPNILMFRDGEWVTAHEPLHTDKPERTGIGMGMSFAQARLWVWYPAPWAALPSADGCPGQISPRQPSPLLAKPSSMVN